jgi:hypothetical protein
LTSLPIRGGNLTSSPLPSCIMSAGGFCSGTTEGRAAFGCDTDGWLAAVLGASGKAAGAPVTDRCSTTGVFVQADNNITADKHVSTIAPRLAANKRRGRAKGI